MSGSLEQQDGGVEAFHCFGCKRVFTSKKGLKYHQKDDRCQSVSCSEAHEHRKVFQSFPSKETALNWINQNELDSQYVVFQGQAKNRPGTYIQYRCINDSRSKKKGSDSTSKKRKSASKKVENCVSSFSIAKARMCQCNGLDLNPNSSLMCENATDKFVIRGCLQHTHAVNIALTRLSVTTKSQVSHDLKLGVSPDVLVEKQFIQNLVRKDVENEHGYSNSDQQQDTVRKKILTLQDAKNMERSCMTKGIDTRKSQLENTFSLLGRPEFIGFNLSSVFPDEPCPLNLMGKKLEGKQLIISFMTPAMKKKFEDHPYTLQIDGTHGTNGSRYTLISILAIGNICIV